MTRTRISAALAALALIGVSVFAGALPAIAAPEPPAWDGGIDGSYLSDAASASLSGSAAPNAIIAVTDSTTGESACLVVADDLYGYWSCYPTLAAGPHTLRATAELDAEVSDYSAVTVYVYATDPTVTIDPVPGGRQPTITGTGPAYGTVDVYDADRETQLCLDLGVEGDGTWSCDTPSVLPFGTTSVWVDSTTYAAATSDAQTSFEVEVPTPNPAYSQGAGATYVDLTADIASQPDVQPYNFATTDILGSPTVLGPCTELICEFITPPGITRLDVAYASTDGSDLVSPVRHDYVRTPAAPSINEPVLGADNAVTFSGYGTTGDQVRVRDSAYVCDDIVEAGYWTCTINNPGPGEHSYAAIAVSVGFDAATAGVTDPNIGNSYDGYSTLSSSVAAIIPSSFDLEHYAAVRGDILTISGTRPANDPAFKVLADYTSYSTIVCSPEQVPATDTTWSCQIDTSEIPGDTEVVQLSAGTWLGEGFDYRTESSADLTLGEATTMDAIGDADGYLYTDFVTVSGTTEYDSGTLLVRGGGTSCEAQVLFDEGTGDYSWSCDLPYLGMEQDSSFTVQRTSGGLVLDSQLVNILTPVSIDLDDDGTREIFAYESPASISWTTDEDGTTPIVSIDGEVVTCDPLTEYLGEGVYWECTLPERPTGSYELSIVQSTPWSEARTSSATTATLVVDTLGGGRDSVQCSFVTSGLSVGSGDDVSIGLYRLIEFDSQNEGYPWSVEHPGLCSGSTGTPVSSLPAEFDVEYHGSCASLSETGGGTAPSLGGVPAEGCDVSGLAPGTWLMTYGIDHEYYYEGPHTPTWQWYFTVPDAPVIDTARAGSSAGVADFSGTGTSGNTVYVIDPGTGFTYCSDVLVTDGAWSCSVTVGESSRQYAAFESDASSGGASALSEYTANLTIYGDTQIIIEGAESAGGQYTIGQGEALALNGQVSGYFPDGSAITASMSHGGAAAVDWTCSAVVEGAFSCSLPVLPLPSGDYDLTFVARNATTTIAELHTIIVTVVGLPPSLYSSNSTVVKQDNTFTLTGGKRPDSSIVVTILGGAPGLPHSFAPCDLTIDIEASIWQCDFPLDGLGLPPGTYELSIRQTLPTGGLGDEIVPRPTLVIVAPVTAQISVDGAQAAGFHYTIPQGTGLDLSGVMSGDYAPGTSITASMSHAGTVIAWTCSALVDGAWSCSLPPTATPPGDYQLSLRATAGTALQATLTSITVTITGVPSVPAPPPAPVPSATPTPTPTPTPTATPVPLAWTFTAGGGEYEPGDETDLVGDNLPPGSVVNAEFHSTPVQLGSTTVGADGTFRLHVTIPEDATPGTHHFVVSVTPPGGATSTVEQAVTITVKPKASGDAPTKSPDAVAFTGGGAVGSDRSDPAAPSSFTFSIRTFKDIASNPIIIGTAAAFGLVLLLLIAFPAELLNSTISEQYPRFSKRLPEVHTPWWDRFTDWLRRTPVVGGILITGLAAFIFGFSDPGFGFDLTSLRVVLSCALALFVVGYLASSISGAIIRRAWGLATEMELKPLGLILTVVGVLISRVIEFAPGFLIGLILGISLVGKTTVVQQARATLVQAGVVFSLSMLGWLGYSFAVATLDPNSFVTALTFDTLVAVTAEGLTALFIGLLPFKFLDGQAVFRYSKVAWSAAYAFAAAAFVLIVVPAAWGDTSGPLWLWMAFIGGFAVVSLGIYLYFRFWAPPLDEDEEEPARESVDA